METQSENEYFWSGGRMNPNAELSSVQSQLQELTLRVGAAAETLQKSNKEDKAADLFEIERLLRTASRRLDRMTN